MAARFTALIVVIIVAATLIAGLVVGAMREEVEPADLIVTNGRVFTADGSGALVQAVAVRGTRIIKVGSTRDIRRLRRDGTVEIDARGGTVMPGFNDAHLHLMSGGLSLSKVELLDATTLDRIGEKIRAFAAANPGAPWVQGRGWYYEPFPGGLPHKALLDQLVPDRPAYMVAYDGHTAWANSAALRLADRLDLPGRIATVVALRRNLAVPVDLDLEPLREGVDAGDADAVQPARDLVRVRLELPAGVELRHHHVERVHPLHRGMRANGDS